MSLIPSRVTDLTRSPDVFLTIYELLAISGVIVSFMSLFTVSVPQCVLALNKRQINE